MNFLREDAAMKDAAINASLGVGLGEKEWNQEKSGPFQAATHKTSLLITERLHGIETRRSRGCG